jgi:5-methylcytosine-specific restriction endonuclease McrA
MPDSTPRRHPRLPDWVRRTVAERYGCQPFKSVGASCTYCGSPGTVSRPDRSWTCLTELEWDHVVPLARGGTHDPANITLACRPCNRRKRDQIWTVA